MSDRCKLCHANPASAEAQFCDLPGCPLNPSPCADVRRGGPASGAPSPDLAGGHSFRGFHDEAYAALAGRSAPGNINEISAAVHQ